MDVSGKSSFEVSSLLQGPSKTFVVFKVTILNYKIQTKYMSY